MIAIGLGLALAPVVALAVYASPAMAVREVRLILPPLPEGHEERRTRDMCKVPTGTPLLRLDVGEYARRLRRLPWVRDVSVARLPNCTVRVRVMLRRPVASLLHKGRRWELDSEGAVIRPTRRAAGLPELTIDGPLQVAEGVALQGRRVESGLAAALMARDMTCLRGARIGVDQTAAICFNNWDKVVIVAGNVEDLPAKLAVIQRIYELEPDICRKLSEIDVTSPRFPAGRPAVAQRADIRSTGASG